MMNGIFNEFSLLHFAAGIIAYFWGVPLLWWLAVHALFEYVENTDTGMKIINKYFTFWPGGGHKKESIANSMIGDNVSAVAGWVLAALVEKKGRFSLDKRTGDTRFSKVIKD
jgi:hypothetical protein